MATGTAAPLPMPREAVSGRVAWVAWAVLAVVVCVFVTDKIQHRPHEWLTNRSEEYASHQWWSQGDLYRPFDREFFLYLPHAAILYTPFHLGPNLLRNLLVRIVYLGLFAAALYVFAGLGDPRRRGQRFLLMTLVCIPLTGHSAQGAQMNLPLGACMLLAAVAIARGRWTWAMVALVLGVALKPLGVVWLLLAVGLWPRELGWRGAVGLVVLAAFPFAFGPPDYVVRQYGDFVHKMTVEIAPTRGFRDIHGLLNAGLGLDVSHGAMLVVRAVAAFATFAIALVARRRWDRTGAALALYVLGATYLMLFNPKTEGPTYTLLGPAIGVLLAWAVLGLGNLPLALLQVAVAYGIAYSWEIWGPRQYWFRPLLALVFLLVAAATILVPRWSRGGSPWLTARGDGQGATEAAG